VGWGPSEGGESGPRLPLGPERRRKRREGKIWAFGPISREREEEKNKYFSNFKTFA